MTYDDVCYNYYFGYNDNNDNDDNEKDYTSIKHNNDDTYKNKYINKSTDYEYDYEYDINQLNKIFADSILNIHMDDLEDLSEIKTLSSTISGSSPCPTLTSNSMSNSTSIFSDDPLWKASTKIYDLCLNIKNNYDEIMNIAFELGDNLFLKSVERRHDYGTDSPYFKLWEYWATYHKIPTDSFKFWWCRIYL